MNPAEDESRLIRVVFDVRNVNILIRLWRKVEAEALKANDTEKALMALAYIKTFQEARVTHGLAPLERSEEKDPSKVMTPSLYADLDRHHRGQCRNGQPDEGDA